MAAGGSERWDNYLGIPKHLVPILGEPLIHRTKRQFGGPETLVIAYDPRYDIESPVIAPELTERTWLPFTGLGHSFPYWSKVYPTTVIFGDVVFSDNAAAIIEHWENPEITFFGRATETKEGHCRELFAIYIPVHEHNRMLDAMRWTKDNREHLQMPTAGGWLCYCYLNKVRLGEDAIDRNFVTIDDGFTDDFDYPDQYDRWIRAHEFPAR